MTTNTARLQLNRVDFQQGKNAPVHRTADYDTSELVVRRGQAFEIIFGFNRAVWTGDLLKVIVQAASTSSTQKNSRAEMPLSNSGDKNSWSAVAGRSSGTSNALPVNINVPVSALIGRYQISLGINYKGSIVNIKIGSFVVLFNPWASDDEVFMSDEAERKEYVLNETGMYWFGNVNSYGSLKWDYGQFQNDILNITLSMLDRSLDYKKNRNTDVSRRNDPGHVGRVLSAMVNSNDENGVVVGNWSGDYSDGVSPTTWNGSAPILRKWKESGPVKYGQCWVYAGVLCTVLRCLGIPARLIVNFQSAHDTDGNLRVDNYYKQNGDKDDYNTEDSVWNFHAWDEAWFARKDLGSAYDGWQVFDATPQETSQGIYCLGPTSLKAVHEGDVDKDYDTVFVFGETNADIVNWLLNPDGTTKLLYSASAVVGQFTSTKAVGSFDRQDVTNGYKYPEGTPKEREIYQKARKIVQPPTTGFSAMMRESAPIPLKPDFSGNFKKGGKTQVGEDLVVGLTLKNSVANPQKIKANMKAIAIIYNNKPVKDILTLSNSISLGPNEEKNTPLTIPYNDYKTAITPDNMIKLVAICEDENGAVLLVETAVKLENPELLMRPLHEVKYGEPVTVDAIFTNPIEEEVHNIVMIVEGSGLIKDQLVIHVPIMKKSERLTLQFEILPCKQGEKCILADFSSKKFPNVKGFHTVVVPAGGKH
ncbi:protein-glutamine gamma-glutamyltransferase E-like [Hyperolius riggenbachi]|uniref:protein-glutamine gamma-glutamyltransferase E-like n=1 Tax=Hyperolius riggenbachi TaxID=752182 RepID=UPI0035A2EB09